VFIAIVFFFFELGCMHAGKLGQITDFTIVHSIKLKFHATDTDTDALCNFP